jgi:hypothetical protein
MEYVSYGKKLVEGEIPMSFQFADGSFELGYNGVPWQLRSSQEDVFYHLAHPLRRPIASFRKEVINAASEIRESRPGNIYIPYSGGADSEGICEAFRLAGIAFTPLIVVYEHDLNRHDVEYAFEYCKKHDIEPVIERVDLEAFYATGKALEMARLCQAWELAYMPVLSVMYAYRQRGFFIGPGEASINRVRGVDGSDSWMYTESERHYCYNKFMMAADINGVPSFYQWSTEVVHSILCDPLVESLANGLYGNRIWGSSILKHNLYQKHLRMATRKKFTGFEIFRGALARYNDAWRRSEEAQLCQNQSSAIAYWYQIKRTQWSYDD